MFLKIKGHLLKVLGDGARRDIKREFGFEIIYQFLEPDIEPISLARIVDSDKAEKLIDGINIVKLDSVKEFNNEIDNNYVERYTLSDSVGMQTDLNLKEITKNDIPGFDNSKAIDSQENLKALYNKGIGGIKKKQKPSYLSE